MKRFQTGKVVSGDAFIGREKIVSEIESYLAMDQSVVLIAPRRYGKSSIIQKVIDDNKGNYKHVSIDLMQIQNKLILAEQIIAKTYAAAGMYGIIEKLRSGSLEVLSTIINYLASMKLTMSDISLEFTEKLIKEGDGYKLLSHALDLPNIFAQKLGVKFLFTIDEFGEIDKLQSKNELLDLIRSTFQKQDEVVFLFAGSQYALMTKIFKDKNSSFFKFAVSVDVPPMKGSDFKQLFKSVFYGNEISIPEDFALEVEKISKGIPYYMVRIAQQALVDAKISNNMNIYCYSVRKATLRVFQKEESYFSLELNKLKGKKYDMIALSAIANNRSFSKELSELGVARQNANYVVKSLVKAGFLAKKKEYEIIDPFLKRYIQKVSI